MSPCAGMPLLRRPALPKAAAPTFRALAGSRQQPSPSGTEQPPSERAVWDREAHAGLQVQLQQALRRAPNGQSMQPAPLMLPHRSVATSSSSTSAAAVGSVDVQQNRLAVTTGRAGRPARGWSPSPAAQQQPATLGDAPLQAGHVVGSAKEQVRAVPDAAQHPGNPVGAAAVLAAAAAPALGNLVGVAVAGGAAPANAAEPSMVDGGGVDSARRVAGSAEAQQPLCGTEAPQQVGRTAAVHGLRGSMQAQQAVQTSIASRGSRKRKHAHAVGPASAPPAPGSSCREPRGEVQAASNTAEKRSVRSTRAAGPATSAPAGRGEAASQADSGSECSLSGSDDVSSSDRETSSTEGEEVLPKRRRQAGAGPAVAELRARWAAVSFSEVLQL